MRDSNSWKPSIFRLRHFVILAILAVIVWSYLVLKRHDNPSLRRISTNPMMLPPQETAQP